MEPSGETWHMDLLGHSGINDRPDGLQIVGTQNRVFVAHFFSNGVSELDVRDPRHPRVLSFTPAPADTWSIHMQVQDGLLLIANAPDQWRHGDNHIPGMTPPDSAHRTAACGMRIYDITRPGQPREIGWMDVGGGGVHRVWYSGGTTAYLSAAPPGHDETILIVADISRPDRPAELARWSMDPAATGGPRRSLHHAIELDGAIYGAWRDGGITLHRIAAAGHLELDSHVIWDGPGGAGCAAHSPVPLPGRELLAVAEEGIEERGEPQERRVLLYDVSNRRSPELASRLPEPGVLPRAGARFGPHNLYEYRPGGWADANIVFVAHQGAGLRVVDVADSGDPAEVAFFRPTGPRTLRDPRPGRLKVCQINDVFVTDDGTVFTVDTNLGMHALAMT